MFDNLWWLLLIPTGIILYFIYQFFIRISIGANYFKKMDPNLKILTKPIFGLLGIQQKNF